MTYMDFLDQYCGGEGQIVLETLSEVDDALAELFETGSLTIIMDDKEVVLTLGVSL
jgi:hypothetical protein